MSTFLSYFTVLTNARPDQGMQNPRPEMWLQLPWLEQKTYQKFGEDTIFFSVCVTWFCMNQGLNLSPEGLFSIFCGTNVNPSGNYDLHKASDLLCCNVKQKDPLEMHQ